MTDLHEKENNDSKQLLKPPISVLPASSIPPSPLELGGLLDIGIQVIWQLDLLVLSIIHFAQTKDIVTCLLIAAIGLLGRRGAKLFLEHVFGRVESRRKKKEE